MNCERRDCGRYTLRLPDPRTPHMNAHASSGVGRPNPYFNADHDMLRDSLRRFIAERVLPHGDLWEEQGMVPRAVLREMGTLGFLGIRYPEEYGG